VGVGGFGENQNDLLGRQASVGPFGAGGELPAAPAHAICSDRGIVDMDMGRDANATGDDEFMAESHASTAVEAYGGSRRLARIDPHRSSLDHRPVDLAPLVRGAALRSAVVGSGGLAVVEVASEPAVRSGAVSLKTAALPFAREE
jgi:hypothetical protein